MSSSPHDLDGSLAADLDRMAASTADVDGPAPALASTDRPAEIRRYALLERLGEGGMGVVYLAYDARLDRKVALKVLRREESAQARARFAREAQGLAKLNHPNVVTVYDAGEVGERPYLAMELVDGTSLRAWLAAAPRSVREIVAVFLAAGRGLAAAHAAGLVHRDIKPDNILVGRDGVARVADFGLVVVLGDDEPAPVGPEVSPEFAAPLRTRDGAQLGTPRYMSPEHRAGRVDPRSDQWSFCVSLREALEGHRAPAYLQAIIARGTDEDPAARYPDMAALLTDLGHDPARSRRRLAAAAAAAFGVAAVGLGSARLASHAPACPDAARQLDGVWDPTVQAAARRSFEATGRPDAAETYARVAGTLDAYARAWTAMSTETCEATAVRHVQSDVLLDRRVACLERRRAGLRELTRLLGNRLDGPAVDRAVDAAGHLEELAPCADTTALMATFPPSRDPRVAAVETRVAAATALFELGRYPEADAAARALFFEAPSIAYAPARARALLVTGRIGRERQDVSEPMLALAESGLRQAIVAAGEARLDDEAVAAWSGLVWTLTKRGKASAALPFELAARAAIARAGDRDRLEVQLAHALGYAWLAVSQTGARLQLERALALATRVYGAGSAEVAHIQVELATAHHDGGHYPEAAALYRQAAATLARVYGPGHPDVADALALLGSSETSWGHLDEARATLQRAQDIYARLDGPDSHRALFVVGEIGLLLTQDERFDEAIVYLRRALAGQIQALGPADKLTALWRINLAATLIPAGQLAEARTELDAALAALTDRQGPNHLFRGMALTFTSWVALEEGHPAEAEAQARAALAIFGKATENELYTAPPMEFIGRSLVARGRPAEAIPLLEKNLVILRAAEGDDGLNAAGGHRQLGTALLAAGRAAEALPHLEHAVAVRSSHGHDDLERATAELLLAQALWHEGQQARARTLAGAALADAQRVGPRGVAKSDEARSWLAAR